MTEYGTQDCDLCRNDSVAFIRCGYGDCVGMTGDLAELREENKRLRVELAELHQTTTINTGELQNIGDMLSARGVPHNSLSAMVREAADAYRELAELRRPVEDAEFIAPRIRAVERERCAALADSVYLGLIVTPGVCPYGNGHVPTGAYRTACDAYAAAIRKGDASG